MVFAAAAELTGLDAGACLELLRTQRRGRIALDVGRRLEWLATNYVLDGDAVVFCTSDDVAFDANDAFGNVTLKVDGYDVDRGGKWRVVVKGHAEEVSAYDLLDNETRLLPAWPLASRLHFRRLLPREVLSYGFKDPRVRHRQQLANGVHPIKDGTAYPDVMI